MLYGKFIVPHLDQRDKTHKGNISQNRSRFALFQFCGFILGWFGDFEVFQKLFFVGLEALGHIPSLQVGSLGLLFPGHSNLGRQRILVKDFLIALQSLDFVFGRDVSPPGR